MTTTKTTKKDERLGWARKCVANAKTRENQALTRNDEAFQPALFAAEVVLDRPIDVEMSAGPPTDQLDTLLEASWALGLDADWQHEAYIEDAVACLRPLIGPTDHRYPTAEDLDDAATWAEAIVTAAEKYMSSKAAQA